MNILTDPILMPAYVGLLFIALNSYLTYKEGFKRGVKEIIQEFTSIGILEVEQGPDGEIYYKFNLDKEEDKDGEGKSD